MARLLAATIAWMATGLWILDGWLEEEPLRFVIWWSICGIFAIVLMIFALYDSVAVVREERNNR